MDYRQVGRSGLVVSEIGLGSGSATFVGRADDQDALRILKHARELGVTYFDTAETYAEGRAETLFGRALATERGDVVIATKFGKDRSVGPDVAPGSRRNVLRAVEGSLRRLGTDYIDLYIFHMPDPRTPIVETLGALDDLVRSGKVRYVGSSDFTAWQTVEAAWTSRTVGLEQFVSAGTEYNLLNRDAERELIPACREYGVGLVPTFPLAGGFLSGKYRKGQASPAGSRFGTVPAMAGEKFQALSRYDDRLSDQNFRALDALTGFAEQRDHTIAELALAWLLSMPDVAAVPVGVTSEAQLSANAAGLGWRLTESELAEIDSLLSEENPMP
jgi:aryl-alcohol dehydrogenase-like predicted oxidoreductase